ncbi:MAG TPA: hypothetical protein VH722_21490 [Alphaproteobacteria bacterium]|jgi:hypothetical protein|nr:hypothetical protein [Alphaproteobacteria bacterium]
MTDEVDRTVMPISALISNFAMACRALVPALDAARIPWQEGKQYDNWERLEEVLFKSLVSEPFEHEALEAGEAARFSRYGFEAEDDRANAKLVVLTNDKRHSWRYIRLGTQKQPFDVVRCVKGGEIRAFPLTEADFRFVVTTMTGETTWSDVRLSL